MAGKEQLNKAKEDLSFDDFKKIVLNDFLIACESREASLLGRKEVLTGKAKFGIFGDGKEVAQIALAKVFKEGDFRSGYYRDQTFMLSCGTLTLEQWFAQLYAHTDVEAEPSSAGRQMNGHYATRSLNPDGTWKDLTKIKNSSSDISPTGSQMPRLLGLAYASYFYRNNALLKSEKFSKFSNNGNEVAFGTIGDASTSEGLFWEAINAGGVLQIPMVISVWDDGHGISVPKKYQTTKESISEILKGFQRDSNGNGYEILKTKGWDYPHLCETYEKAARLSREHHVPVLVHVEEVTQPQGHSTSGSHERYKSKERLEWEVNFDCIRKMKEWMLGIGIANEDEIAAIELQAKTAVKDAKNSAWKAFNTGIKSEIAEVTEIINGIIKESGNAAQVSKIKEELLTTIDPVRRDIIACVKKVLRTVREEQGSSKQQLNDWLKIANIENYDRYSSNLYSNSDFSVSNVAMVPVQYRPDDKTCDGREIIRDNFDVLLSKYPEVLIFGEDSGKIGGVNQGLEGLQSKHGEHRVFDTGIREATILGQAIGLAMRGLRPIAEIQYLDYLLYALQIMSDDLATIQYRTKGGQKAPVIVRTRGHRLEGIWHSGSPMGVIINALRGIYICVPRNMTKATAFYNTLLQADDPAIVIEPLNGYRLKEKAPVNFGEYTLQLGVPEIIREGTDVTIVTYGSCCKIAMDAAVQLEECGISAEIIDVQTLLPFDINNHILESVKKTNRVLFFDEDVPGGASAYMMQKVLEEQKAFQFLDAEPKTLSAKEHRPAYGSDGDYFSKPNVEDVFDAVYEIMHEANPTGYPAIY